MSHQVELFFLLLTVAIHDFQLCPVEVSHALNVFAEIVLNDELILIEALHQGCDVFGVCGRLRFEIFNKLVTEQVFIVFHL